MTKVNDTHRANTVDYYSRIIDDYRTNPAKVGRFLQRAGQSPASLGITTQDQFDATCSIVCDMAIERIAQMVADGENVDTDRAMVDAARSL